jgi:hypothetical protein
VNARMLLRQLQKLAPSQLPAECGVYAIVNRDTGRSYIGSTLNIKARVGQHVSCLRGGQHSNSMLQADWGHDKFDFGVLALCKPEERLAIEEELVEQVIGAECYNWSGRGQRPHVNPGNYQSAADKTAERMKRLRASFDAWLVATNAVTSTPSELRIAWAAWHDGAFNECERIAGLIDELDGSDAIEAWFAAKYD